MEIQVINKSTDSTIRREVFARLTRFLSGLSCDYPFFEEWLSHVFSHVKSGERSILICNKDEYIAGVVILKDTVTEKKICTIRVATKYRRQGIGTMLMIKAFELLNDDYPLITVSDDHILDFRPFLLRFGFREMSKINSVYRYGHSEYYFNKPYKHKTVMMSIKPQFSNRIMSGKKTIEFRKVCFADNVTKVYIYSSSPQKRIIGYFDIDKIVRDSPKNLWKKYSKRGCIEEDNFYRYFHEKQYGYGICIRRFVKLRQEVELDDVFDREIKVRPPQNYCYIDNVVVLRRLLLLE